MFLRIFIGFWMEIQTHVQHVNKCESSYIHVLTITERNAWDTIVFSHCSHSGKHWVCEHALVLKNCTPKNREWDEIIIVYKLLNVNNYPVNCLLESPQWETLTSFWISMQQHLYHNAVPHLASCWLRGIHTIYLEVFQFDTWSPCTVTEERQATEIDAVNHPPEASFSFRKPRFLGTILRTSFIVSLAGS